MCRNHGKTDILGFSYYPYWEKFESDQKRLAGCLRGYAKTYHKPVMITEVGGPDADEESSYQIVADAVGAMKEMDQEELGIFYWEPEGTARILPDGYPLCAARIVGRRPCSLIRH